MSAEVEAAAQVIAKHAEHMRGYTLPSLDYFEGYWHALRLFERDSGFIAQDILSLPALAARDAARDAALRESLAVEVEAAIADLWIPSPVQPGSIAHNELLHDVRSIVAARIIRGAAQ